MARAFALHETLPAWRDPANSLFPYTACNNAGVFLAMGAAKVGSRGAVPNRNPFFVEKNLISGERNSKKVGSRGAVPNKNHFFGERNSISGERNSKTVGIRDAVPNTFLKIFKKNL